MEGGEMSERTKEPWRLDRYGGVISADGQEVAANGFTTVCSAGDYQDHAKANSRRIVACVNACAGIADPINAIPSLLRGNERLLALETAARQRDELLAALLKVARMSEALKRQCSMDPESAQATRNGEYMNISYAARAAIARAEGREVTK
jgi:hypothetical protein